jgi:hypothetical protein
VILANSLLQRLVESPCTTPRNPACGKVALVTSFDHKEPLCESSGISKVEEELVFLRSGLVGDISKG